MTPVMHFERYINMLMYHLNSLIELFPVEGSPQDGVATYDAAPGEMKGRNIERF